MDYFFHKLYTQNSPYSAQGSSITYPFIDNNEYICKIYLIIDGTEYIAKPTFTFFDNVPSFTPVNEDPDVEPLFFNITQAPGSKDFIVSDLILSDVSNDGNTVDHPVQIEMIFDELDDVDGDNTELQSHAYIYINEDDDRTVDNSASAIHVISNDVALDPLPHFTNSGYYLVEANKIKGLLKDKQEGY